MIGETGRNLVFIFSLPRSGSTLLSTILGNHSSVSCPPEPWLLLRLQEVYGDASPGKIFDDSLARLAVRAFLTEAEFMAAARCFALQAYNSVLARSGGSVLVDKTPRYYHILDVIEELFPDARKIWLKRNPLDIAASYKTSWAISPDSLSGKNLIPSSFDLMLGLPNLATYFARKSSLKYEIQYESLVNAPETEIRKLAEFCGVEFEPSMLDVCPTAKGMKPLLKSELGDRKIRVTSGISRESIGIWRDTLNKQEVVQLTAHLGSQIFIDTGYAEIVTEHPDYFDPGLDRTHHEKLGDNLAARFRAAADVHKLEQMLAESDAERTACLEDVHKLERMLTESDTERAARLEDVHKLQKMLIESDAERAARMEDVHRLEQMLAESSSSCAHAAAERDSLSTLIERVRKSYIFRLMRTLGLWGWLDPEPLQPEPQS